MNRLKAYNEYMRKPLLIDVICTVTTADGKVDAVRVTIPRNKINKLNGNSLSSHNLYELAKKGATETTDLYGNHFAYKTETTPVRALPTTPETTASEQGRSKMKLLNSIRWTFSDFFIKLAIKILPDGDEKLFLMESVLSYWTRSNELYNKILEDKNEPA
jgi:hypothetical protein